MSWLARVCWPLSGEARDATENCASQSVPVPCLDPDERHGKGALRCWHLSASFPQ